MMNGNFVTGWLYQDQLNPVVEVDSLGSIITRFVYGSRGNIPDYLVKDGVVYRYITDHLGSVRFLVNLNTGAIVQELDYDEFGKVLKNTNESFQPFTYAGGLYDSQTDLIRFGARDYYAAIGRWTAKDPIGFDGSFSNLYLYVKDDPINYFDPAGLKCKRSFWQRTWDAFNFTNEKVMGVTIPGALSVGGLVFNYIKNRKIPTALDISMITSGVYLRWLMSKAVTKVYTTPSLFGWISSRFGGFIVGKATFTAAETGILAGASSGITATLVAASFEVGVGIGSMISAALLPCVEEPDPCK